MIDLFKIQYGEIYREMNDPRVMDCRTFKIQYGEIYRAIIQAPETNRKQI